MNCACCSTPLAFYGIDGVSVCYDCYATIKDLPAEERMAAITHRLQTVHAQLLAGAWTSQAKDEWLTVLATRISACLHAAPWVSETDEKLTEPVVEARVKRSGPIKVIRKR